MARVTMELRNVLTMENLKLFNFDYPCDDAAWKAALENLFIRTYYFREIGVETIDRFLYELETKFLTIMPYYNELYKTTLLEIDPLINSRLTETYNATSKSDVTSNGTDVTANTNTDELKDYEYPQQDNAVTDIAAGRKLSTGSTNNTTTATNTGTTDNLIDYSKIIEGVNGDQSALLKAYRANILNINKMVIDECKDLFIRIY